MVPGVATACGGYVTSGMWIDVRLAVDEPLRRADDLLDGRHLGEHIVRPRLHSPCTLCHALVSGKREYRNVGLGLVQLFDKLAPVPVREVEVDDGKVGRSLHGTQDSAALGQRP